MTGKLKVGDKVNYPAAPDGTFPAGTGTIASITGTVIRVTRTSDNAELNHDFVETDLTIVK